MGDEGGSQKKAGNPGGKGGEFLLLEVPAAVTQRTASLQHPPLRRQGWAAVP